MPINAGRRYLNINLNGNQLCSIDIKTTGPDPLEHEICELAIIPLFDDFSRRHDLQILDLLITPQKNNIDIKYCRLKKTPVEKSQISGHSHSAATMLLERWISDLELGYNKKIAPVAYNYSHEQSFLIEWLGRLNYATMFDDTNIRDVRVAARFLNDFAYIRDVECPYKKVEKSWLCKTLNVFTDYGTPKAALHNAAIEADIYAEMMKQLAKHCIN